MDNRIEELKDKVENATEAIIEAQTGEATDAADALNEISELILALNDEALRIYSDHGGFTANAEAYWHAHVRGAVNDDGGHAPSMRTAAKELENIAEDDDDDEGEGPDESTDDPDSKI